MKTLDQVKDEVAKEFGYSSFEQFDDRSTFGYDHNTPKIIDLIAKLYANAKLEEAAERLKHSDDGRCIDCIEEQNFLHEHI